MTTFSLCDDGEPIEDLQPGDAIVGADPGTGELVGEVVIEPLVSEGDKHLIALWFGQDPVPVIATDNHPYWVDGVGWVQAGSLQPGDVAATSTGTTLVLQDVADLGWFTDQSVYNLHASGTHTYFVTATPDQPDQLVHNASSCSIAEYQRQVSKYGEGGVRHLDDGRIRFYGELSPARTPGVTAGRRLVREWDTMTGSKRQWHESLDHAGRVRQVRPENGGPKTHYRFDSRGRYLGSW